MEKRTFELVSQCYKNVLAEDGIIKEITPETPVMDEGCLDSMGIVSLIIELEDQFNLDLDDHLLEIRAAKNVSQLVTIIETCK